MLGREGLVVSVVARHVKRHQVSKLEVRKRSGAIWVSKGEVLPLRDSVCASDVRACELRWLWRRPVEAPGSIPENTEVAVIRDSQVVDTVSRADAGLACGSPEASRRRVGDAEPRPKVSVPGGRNRTRNARVSRNEVTQLGVRKLDRLHSRNWRRQTSIDVAPRPGDIPTKAEVQGEIGSRLPGVLTEEPTVTSTVVEKLNGALDKAARSADEIVRHIRVRLLAIKIVIAVGSAGIPRIQLVVPELASKADRVIAEGLAYRVANRVVRLGLIKIQPVGADGKGVEKQGR